MKVALVHDYLTRLGGAERVLAAFSELWPDAKLFTLLKKPFTRESFSQEISTSFLDQFPAKIKTSKFFVPLYPFLVERFDLSPFDVVVSSGYFSKAVLTYPDQLHINYCHTPPRFLYHYSTEAPIRKSLLGKISLPLLDHKLRVWDFLSAQRPDTIVANSETVASRIRSIWRRNVEVVYPPVEIDPVDNNPLRSGKNSPIGKQRNHQVGYFLVVSRLETYKNVDVVIEACNRLQVPLKIVGTGSEQKDLESLAGPTTKFLGRVSDQELNSLYRRAGALIVAASEEDFGITPVEAMSKGTPVVALRSGGFQETVVEGKTGLFFEQPEVTILVKVLQQMDTFYCREKDCYKQAEKFSKRRFKARFHTLVQRWWQDKRESLA
ncbi:MAG: glycosyltransferase [Patescibacteria group bacterium]